GLTPSDAPSLADRIAMILQSRIIENPALSATDLISQLAHSIPATFLPPRGVVSIIQSVQNQIVPPTKSTDTTPPAISCGSPDGLWHATDVSVACTSVD